MLSSPRAAVSAAFLIHSTVSGTWAPRLPAIKESLGLSDGELGTALVGLAIGLVVGTRVAGAPVDRFGSRPVMRVGFPLLAATLLLPGLADSLVALFLSLFVLGLASGALDVAMNAQGIEVERHLGRPILSGLHGLWSVGLGIGAGLGRAGGGDRTWSRSSSSRWWRRCWSWRRFVFLARAAARCHPRAAASPTERARAACAGRSRWCCSG